MVPGDFDFRKLSASQFGMHWGEDDIEVQIWFASPAAAYVRERLWHPSQTITDNADGSLVLALTVNHLLELQRWILSWGAMAQVLEPPSLVEEVRNTVQSLAEHYPQP